MVWRRALIWSVRVVSGNEVFEGEGGVVPEYGRVGIGRIEAGEARRRQPVPRRLPLRPCCLQPVAERHQFINLGNDAVLLGERAGGGMASARIQLARLRPGLTP